MQTTNDTGFVLVQTSTPATGAIPQVAPTAQKERILLLDSLRGFAILGILLMNMPGMGLPSGFDASILNETGRNIDAWFFMSWFADGTQRALFSLLFGAGVLLFISNKEKALAGSMPAELFFRRQIWLVVFGLVNIYILLWSGDILFDYGCYGFLLFVFRNWKPKALFAAAFVCMMLMILRENMALYQDKKVIARGEAIAAMDTTVNKLTVLQKEELAAYTGLKERTSLQSKKNRAETAVAKMNTSFGWAYEHRTSRYLSSFVNYFYFAIWDVLQFMFLGMALFKTGALLGKSSTRTYLLLCVAGLGIGLTLSWFRSHSVLNHNFNWFEYAKQVNFQFYNLDRTFRALGIFGGIMLLYKSGLFKWLFKILQPTGQMAFTNYLMQSFIALVLFTGFGFSLFGKMERYQLYLLVGGIWIFQILLSNIWLKQFRFGPLEWAWRCLTYWKIQPMRK